MSLHARTASLPQSTSDGAESRDATWLAAGVILLAVVLAYANGMAGPFVFDDLDALRDNPTIHVGARSHAFSPPPRTTVAGRPLLNASFALSDAIGGGSTVGHHVVNVAIHAAAALVLFGLIRRTLQRRAVSGRDAYAATLVAGAAALVWAVHPLQTEAVTYLVQRAESLMALFYLLTLYGFARGIAASRGAGGGAGWFAVALVACAAGMATKEVMVSAPVLVLLYDRVFVAASYREIWRQRGRWYAGLAATWLILGALVASAGGNRGGSIGFGVEVGWWDHAATQAGAILHYLRLAVWPHPLVFEYEPMWLRGFGAIAPATAVVLALLVGTAYALGRAKPVGFIGALFFAVLAPTSLLPAPTQLIVEHRMYLALAALLSAAGWGLWRAIGRTGLFASVTALAALALGVLTHVRNEDYRTEASLWRDTVAKRPNNALAHASLGTALLREGRVAEAVAECTTAVRLDPNRAIFRYNLGQAFERAGQPANALAAYAEAVRLEPEYADAHTNYAALLARSGQTAAAQREFEQAVRLRPDDAVAHYDLGALLSDTGHPAEAVAEFAAAVRLRPADAVALTRWGTTLAMLGRIPEALDRYAAALRADPGNVAARNKRGLVLLMAGNASEAAASFEEVLRLDPSNTAAQQGLAMARRRLAQPMPSAP
jgi:protein O-mannosyl-transferase